MCSNCFLFVFIYYRVVLGPNKPIEPEYSASSVATPRTQRTVHQFLDLIPYLRRYVKGFAFDALKWKLVEAPILGRLQWAIEWYTCHRSTKPKKNRNITDQWTPECQDAFDALKWKLVEASILGRLQWTMLPRSWRKFERIIACLRRYVEGFAKIAKSLNGLLTIGSTKPKKNRNITDQCSVTDQWSVRMRFMPWSGNLLKHPYLDDFSEPCCLEVDASLRGLYHTSVGMLRDLLKLQNHWMVYLDDIHIYTWTTSVNHVA